VLLAILGGLDLLVGNWVVWVLAILGVLLAFLIRSKADTAGFLLPAIALQLSAGAAEAVPAIGGVATAILQNVVIFTSGILLFIAIQMIVARLDFKTPRIWIEAAGVLVAILAAVGIIPPAWAVTLLAAVGVVVGILRLVARAATKKADNTEAVGRFLLAAIALLLSANAFNNVPIIGELVGSFFSNIVILVTAVLLVFAFVATFRWLEETT
jgi:hypothetical protein